MGMPPEKTARIGQTHADAQSLARDPLRLVAEVFPGQILVGQDRVAQGHGQLRHGQNRSAVEKAGPAGKARRKKVRQVQANRAQVHALAEQHTHQESNPTTTDAAGKRRLLIKKRVSTTAMAPKNPAQLQHAQGGHGQERLARSGRDLGGADPQGQAHALGRRQHALRWPAARPGR